MQRSVWLSQDWFSPLIA